MGLFDFFRRDKGASTDSGRQVDRKFANLAKTATDKRAQAYDRDEALRALCALGTPQAAEVLLKRFTFKVDPSITDEEEKAMAFDGIVRVGTGAHGIPLGGQAAKHGGGELPPLTAEQTAELRNAVVESVRKFCERAESLNWPLRVLRELLDDAAYEAEVLRLLGQYDTEYTRNVEPKIDLITALAAVISPAAQQAVEAYLDDVNETVRFHAVETTFAQGAATAVPALVALMQREESVRIKNKVAEGLIRQGWAIAAAQRADFADALQDVPEYRLSPEGKVRKA